MKMVVTPFDLPYQKTHAACKLHGCMCYRSGVNTYCRSKFYIAEIGIVDLFCSRDLDLDPMTFIPVFRGDVLDVRK